MEQEHIHKLTIYAEHTDFEKIVYYVNYIEFCEIAQEELGSIIPQKFTTTSNITSYKCKFYKPSILSDVVLIKTKINNITENSICIAHEIQKESSGEKIFESSCIIKIK